MISPRRQPERLREDELMDDPHLDRTAHRAALAGLSRINAVSRVNATLWPAIRETAGRLRRGLRVLDVATGGGDVALGLLRRAGREKVAIEVAGCDISRRAVAIARARARRMRLPARFFQWDALDGALPGGYDAITSTLFLHHLEPADVVALLRRMKVATGSLLLVDDLRRSFGGIRAAVLAPRLLTRSRIVHVDAVRSSRAAFTEIELATMADEAGLHGHAIVPHWPWRQLLHWRPS